MKKAFILGSFVMSCTVKVERFPAPGESLSATSFILEPGGKGFNMMVAAHRLGVPIDGILAIGDDLAGTIAPQLIAQCGLPDGLILRTIGQTGGGVGFTDQHGESSLAVFSGANDRLEISDILNRRTAIERSDIVAAPFEIPNGAIHGAFSLARQSSVPTILNPSPYKEIPSEILKLTDILVVNHVESLALMRDFSDQHCHRSEQLADALHALGVKTLIITKGAEGATAYCQDGSIMHCDAIAVTPVDSIGAGDAFNAGLIAALCRNLPLNEALTWACVNGGLATQTAGTLAAFPDAECHKHHLAALG